MAKTSTSARKRAAKITSRSKAPKKKLSLAVQVKQLKRRVSALEAQQQARQVMSAFGREAMVNAGDAVDRFARDVVTGGAGILSITHIDPASIRTKRPWWRRWWDSIVDFFDDEHVDPKHHWPDEPTQGRPETYEPEWPR